MKKPQSNYDDANHDEWFRRSFSDDYLKIYRHRDAAEAQNAIRNLLRLMNVQPGAICLDLACGFGRHLVLLRELGFIAFGLDLSKELLHEAKLQIELSGHLMRADMRSIPLADESLDYVFSFFSSFGYFTDDAENKLVLNEIHRVLKPNGSLLLDFLNAAQLEKNLVEKDKKQFDDFTLSQHRFIDRNNNTIVKDMIIRDKDGERKYRESVKLYQKKDFIKFCGCLGFRPKQWWGNYDGSEFMPDSPRLILWAEKI